MDKTIIKERKSMTLLEIIKRLQKEFKALWFEWKDELNEEFLSEIEFLLWDRWWWLLCHINKEYPHIVRFRLIGERDYIKCKPREFVELAKQKLLH